MADKRLLFVCPSLELGGAERYVATLAPALRDRDFDVSVIVLKHRGPFLDQLAAGGIATHDIAMRSRYDMLGARRALKLVGPQPDAVISQSTNAQVLGHLIARRAGAVHVTIEHAGIGLGTRAHRRALRRLFGGRADAVVAVSASQVPPLVDAGYQRDRVHVIPNGVGRPVPERPRDAVRAELGLSDDDFVAILVATLRPEKRASLFVDAVAAAHRRDPRVQGVIVGGGAELDTILARVRSEPSVRAVGPRSDVAALVGAADIACLSSRTEGMPVAVLEAMALGKPVVATSVGGIPEAVVSGVTGVLVEPDDGASLTEALLSLAGSPETVAELGRRARERHDERFTVERMADRYAALLNRLLRR